MAISGKWLYSELAVQDRFYCITIHLFYASKNHEVDLLIRRQSVITASLMSRPFYTAHVQVHVQLINGRQCDTFHKTES